MHEIINGLLTLLSGSITSTGRERSQIDFTTMHPKDIEDSKKARVNIFPYHVNEDTDLRNRRGPVTDSSQNLDCHCMVTAYAGNDLLAELMLLDEVRCLLVEKPILTAQGGQTVLSISMIDKSPDDLANLWQALQTPLRPSLHYLVKRRAATRGRIE